jgi:isoleucyl-tRNA synthetase
VHLASWPTSEPALVDDALSAQMALVRRLVELGRAARAEAKVRGRQPLARALVGAAGWTDLPDELRRQVADELNVGGFEVLAGDLVEHRVKANFRSLGARFGQRTPAVAQAVAAADPGELAAALRDSGRAEVLVDGEPVEVGPEDVLVTETPREGWAVSTDGGETIALDLTITPELRRAGLAREVTRLVQEARKSAGLDVSDRIRLWWRAEGETATAMREHGRDVAAEVLAVELLEGEPPAAGRHHRGEDAGLGLRFALTRTEQ